MTKTGTYHGGIVTRDKGPQALLRFSRVVSTTFKDYGHPVERESVPGDGTACIVTPEFIATIEKRSARTSGLHSDRRRRVDTAAGLNCGRKAPDMRPVTRTETETDRYVLTLQSVNPGQEDREITELMLVVMLYRTVDLVAVEEIEWLAPDIVLKVEQFLSVFADVSPSPKEEARNTARAKIGRFAPVEETAPDLAMHYDAILGMEPDFAEFDDGILLSEDEALAHAFRTGTEELADDSALDETDIRRLAAWGMTGMLATLSAPVAVSMAAVNLMRGEDFRLNTHVLSLTGLIVVLQSSGALADVLSHLPG